MFTAAWKCRVIDLVNRLSVCLTRIWIYWRLRFFRQRSLEYLWCQEYQAPPKIYPRSIPTKNLQNQEEHETCDEIMISLWMKDETETLM